MTDGVGVRSWSRGRWVWPALFTLSYLGLLAAPPSLEAQRFRRSRSQVHLGDGLPDRPGGFTFCRLAFVEVRREPGGSSWDTDFPNADRNLTTRLPQLTPTRVSSWEHGEPGFAIVRATDPELFECPFLFASHVGVTGFDPQEVAALQEYFDKGGFLWVDDFWGNAAWNQWERQMALVFPGRTIVDLPMEHPLFEIVYEVPRLPQIPSIQHWRRSGGGTSERGLESRQPHIRAVLDDDGTIMVLITHNTDIADGWEREAEDPRFFYQFSPDAYAVGVNIVVWMMTH
jgi:hypothetical protein